LKSLYLYKNHYDLREKPSLAQQAIFDEGSAVGLFARSLFPGGYDASVTPAFDYRASVEKTALALQSGETVIYEAGFLHQHLYAAIDILVIKEDGWYLYEVKSSRSIKQYQYLDAAVQWYLLRQLELPIRAVHLVSVKKEFVKHGPISPTEFFVIHEVTDIALSLQSQVSEKLTEMVGMLKNHVEPKIKIGPHCEGELSCDYLTHCWKAVKEAKFPITSLYRLGDKKWPLLEKGIFCQTLLGEGIVLTKTQKEQVNANLTQTSPPPQLANLRSFLATIHYPIAFFDFETFDTVLPLFDGTSPKQAIPFQYSLHLLTEDGEVTHHCYLGDGISDPRPALVEQLINEIGSAATVLCYNVTFEKSRLQELMSAFPKYNHELQAICGKLVDLIVPFRKRYVYHYRMNGSSSIKKVLPAFLPHLSYEHLEIGEGMTASRTYLKLSEMDKEEKERTRAALLAYCEMDTWAMVELYRFLQRLCSADQESQ